MTLEGKGFYLWKVLYSENGDPNAIANVAQQAGFSHVLVKIADGTSSSNVDLGTNVDLAAPVVQALKARGIKVWGWHYVYGVDPLGEANKAIQRIQQLNVDGYVIDAEGEFKQAGKDEAARKYTAQLRAALPDFPIALSSYRYPTFHPQFPWRIFLEKVDINMPQVYWLQAHNAGEQLIRCVREFQSVAPLRPIIPTGAAFKSGDWAASPGEVTEFLQTAQNLNLGAANFWEWANCRKNLPDVWTAIQNYSWAPAPPTEDIVKRYMTALNSRDPNQMVTLYQDGAVHVTAARTIAGLAAIHAWYSAFFNQVLPNATFTLTGSSGTGSTRQLTWTAKSPGASVQNGNDTLGLLNDKISYHYTFFTVS